MDAIGMLVKMVGNLRTGIAGVVQNLQGHVVRTVSK